MHTDENCMRVNQSGIKIIKKFIGKSTVKKSMPAEGHTEPNTAKKSMPAEKHTELNTAKKSMPAKGHTEPNTAKKSTPEGEQTVPLKKPQNSKERSNPWQKRISTPTNWIIKS